MIAATALVHSMIVATRNTKYGRLRDHGRADHESLGRPLSNRARLCAYATLTYVARHIRSWILRHCWVLARDHEETERVRVGGEVITRTLHRKKKILDDDCH